MSEGDRTPDPMAGEAEPADYVDAVVPDPGDRGRRRRTLGALAVIVVAVAATVAVVQTTGRPRPADRVQADAGPEGPTPATSVPAPRQVELQLATGWQELLADGAQLVVGTRPLGDRDLLLAVLARDDAVFSDFPPDGAVLVIGGDRLTAKYVGVPSAGVLSQEVAGGASIELGPDAVVGPGPALGLGPAKSLVGGVTMRSGDVPKSSVILAGYFGPQAPAGAAQEAEAMAATVRLAPLDPAAVPPPPPGSRPGFDAGGVELPAGQGVEAAVVDVPGATYTARADADCAVVTAEGSNQPLGGGCAPRPTGATADVAAVATAIGLPRPPPGQSVAPGSVAPSPSTMIILARVGPDARRVTALLTDGRETAATVGRDGWVLLATDGRAFLLDIRDGRGTLVARTPVT